MLYRVSRVSFIVFCIFCSVTSSAQKTGGGGGGGVGDGDGDGPEALVLSCGSNNGGVDADGRKWEPDEKFLSSKGDSKFARATFQDPSLPSQVPYMDARVFKQEISYEFSVKPDSRYWIRFHFYPSTYPELKVSDSYFSALANDFTLLSNFSASMTALSRNEAYVMREFSLAPMESDTLKITFKPSDKHPGSFGFINGIELVPSPDLFGSATMLGMSDDGFDGKAMNMQTMYRLNVAGQYIGPKNDSGGLMRTWYSDEIYIYGAGTGVAGQADPSIEISYNDQPEYSAPVDVYKTAREMGPSAEVNREFNLTWFFTVDPDFLYSVRLHFCEFRPNITKQNQIAFNIFINSQAAQVYPRAADPILFAGGQGIPTYRDYVIHIEDSAEDEIYVSMSPSVESEPEYYDVLLNGLEIFKLEKAKSLAGPNPDISKLYNKAVGSSSTKGFTDKSSSNIHVLGGAAGGAAAVGLVAALCVAVYQRKRRIPGAESHTSSWLPIYGNSQTSASKSTISGKSATAGSQLSAIAQGLCRRFSLSEIKHATKSFDESYVIGVGGFGKVYKGVLEDKVKVAIKRSNPSSEQGVNEFVTEIEMLSKLRHKHLVSLIGFCEENDEMCLVYDYMALGTLREHIYNTKKPLPWKQRLEICIGAARGLHYLHTGAKYTIIHRDVKTTNILLDENWVAKVSDFGLSKTGPNMENGHVSTVVKGSFGYLDPEYFKRQQLTEKSDIYSFGVVLFEVLCARPALNPNLPKEQVSLADWALSSKRRGKLDDIIDPLIKDKMNPECLKKFADTAEKCLSDSGIDRPSMGDVLWNLEFALQMVESTAPSSHCSRGSSLGGIEDVNALYRRLESDHESVESSDQSTAIFSQIANPTGR